MTNPTQMAINRHYVMALLNTKNTMSCYMNIDVMTALLQVTPFWK